MKKISFHYFLLFILLFFLFIGCARQNYTRPVYQENSSSDSSQVTPTGEKIGSEDIKRLPKLP